MIQNIKQAIWDKETILVGGGEFGTADLRQLLRQARLGSAIEMVCKDLRPGCEVIISLEKDAGTVVLIDYDGNEHDIEGGDTFAQDIENAITAAGCLP
jgi:hypothetical protein